MAGARWKKVGLVMSFATMISEEAAATHTETVIDDIENSDELIAPVNRYVLLSFFIFTSKYTYTFKVVYQSILHCVSSIM